MPKISVVMPVYNGEKYLKDAIDSILNQTFSDFEFIMINDSSTDNTENIIKSYSDKRIKYIKNEKNFGVAKSLNKGLDMACGEYIARMDADDISMPKRFEKQVKYMDRHKDIAVCGGAIKTFGEVQEIKKYNISNKEKIKIACLFKTCLFHPTVMMRRSVIEQEKYRYNVDYDKVEDFELWTRIMLKYNISNINSVLLKYRVHKNQVTKNYDEEYKQLLSEIKQKYLSNIGIELSNKEIKAINDYFLEEIDYNKQTEILILAFKRIIEGNKKLRFFNERALRRIFAKISLNSIEMQHIYDKKKLIEVAGFIKFSDIQKNSVKIFLKSIIGRG